jgi:serine protease
MKKSQYLWLALSAAMTLGGAAARANPPAGAPLKLASQGVAPVEEETISRLIIKPRQKAGQELAGALKAKNAEALSKAMSVKMTVVRPMSDSAHVVMLDKPVTLSEAKVMAARLMKNNAVELAEPDRIMRPFLSVPNDPRYGEQWHYHMPNGINLGGANVPGAWGVTTGNDNITVAILDTGMRAHADLGPLLVGYDFISDPAMANDGNGRDANAFDPGDAVNADECGAGGSAKSSSWHGTHVAGTVAAVMNNNAGVVGIAPDVRILPVRVLGKCGGYTSDIVDGMRWAAGLPVAGVPNNSRPAHVLNLSLGARGNCSAAFQSAVNAVLGAGKVIVAAAGNDSADQVSQPANCSGVLAVTAHAIDGDNASYANVGPEVAISAPGGGCGTVSMLNGSCDYAVNGLHVLSLSNSGVSTPGTDTYALFRGTSMAAPHVAGVAALMLSAYRLTSVQVRSHLRSSARPHPSGTACVTLVGKCGAGLLDAVRALNSVAAPVATIMNPVQVVTPNAVVSLSGTATATENRAITGYAWAQVSGAFVGPLANADTPNATFTAGTTGTTSFELTVTDDAGLAGKATAIVRVNSAPILSAVSSQAFMQGAAAQFQVGATDADGDHLFFHGVSVPAGASLSATGVFSWPDAPAGDYTLTYYASDSYADSAVGSVNIRIAPSNAGSGGGSGGGGGMGGASLMLLAALAGARRVRRMLALH